MYIPSLKYFIAKTDLASSEASESRNIFAGRESSLDIDCCWLIIMVVAEGWVAVELS